MTNREFDVTLLSIIGIGVAVLVIIVIQGLHTRISQLEDMAGRCNVEHHWEWIEKE